jgi:3-oxoadipate enol-lactonase
MKANANGIAINYVIDGPADGADDAPWVTFSTGITNDTTMWDDHVAELAGRYRLLRYDSRGHGGSDATAPPYTFDMLTGDVIGLWDALGIERSHLVGIGLGGMTAMALALDHPDRVSALVPTACRAALIPEYQAIWPPMVEIASDGGIEAIVERTATRWFPDAFRDANPATMDKVRAMIRRTSLDGYLGCISALLTLDIGARVGELAMPTLFVSGALDMLGGPPEVMQGLADSVPGARHVTLADAGHICNIANAPAFTRALAEFFATVGGN